LKSFFFRIRVLAVVASSGVVVSLTAGTPNAWLYSGLVLTLCFLALHTIPPLSRPSSPPSKWLRSFWAKLSRHQRFKIKLIAGLFASCLFSLSAKTQRLLGRCDHHLPPVSAARAVSLSLYCCESRTTQYCTAHELLAFKIATRACHCSSHASLPVQTCHGLLVYCR
jgi:hypothetical protein